MRIGLWVDDEGRTVEEVGREIRAVAEAGADTVWLSERGTWDPLTLLAAVGPLPRGAAVGTSIVRSYPRHPLALAAQARTAQAATGGRLVLGVGPSHAALIEGVYGYDPSRPVENLREYVSLLRPLLRGEEVARQGRWWSATGRVSVPAGDTPTLALSALGPRMLRLTAELADATLTTWMGPRTLHGYVLPTLTDAAATFGRPVPEILAGVCVSLTDDPDRVRGRVHELFGAATGLPSYQAVFEREGVRGPADTVVAGDESALEREFGRFADAGVAELQIIACGDPAEQARTHAFAAALATRSHVRAQARA
jgi:F420-dependent oxidoreductase-like protein